MFKQSVGCAAAWDRVRLGFGLALAVAAVGILTGCARDPRISVEEFLEMQKQYEHAEGTAPAGEDAKPDYSMLDKVLGPYRVGPGDTLEVTFSGTDVPFESPVTVRIDREGTIVLPLVGSVNVMDQELEDVEDAITEAYVPRILKDVAIHTEITSFETTNVVVLGAVQVPGFVQLRRTERTMLHTVVMAGGVTGEATGRTTLRRLRRPDQEVRFDLTQPDELRAALTLEPLEDGDMITVEAVPEMLFVGGLVNAPGPQIYGPGVHLNVLQAVAAAGGLRTDVTPRDGTLIRRMPDGQDVQVKLNMDRLARGELPNLQLASGDILWIPDTTETRIQDFINRNFFFRVGASATASYNVSGLEFINRRRLQSARGGAGSGGLQDSFDPFGFLGRNAALQGLSTAP